MMSESLPGPCPRNVTAAIASRIGGNARITSIARMTLHSTAPRYAALATPRSVPLTDATRIEVTATPSETRAP